MKVKNLVIGLRVQVKSNKHTGFIEESAGKFGVIIKIEGGSGLDVKVELDDSDFDWGNHKGIKRAPIEATESTKPEVQAPLPIAVGSRVRLKSNGILGFLAGDVGTVKRIDSAGVLAVHFDISRNGWSDVVLDIPNQHGLWVAPAQLEVITN